MKGSVDARTRTKLSAIHIPSLPEDDIAWEMPTDRPRPAGRLAAPAQLSFSVPLVIADAVRHWAVQSDCMLPIALVTSWATLLARWSGAEEVAFEVRIPSDRGPESPERSSSWLHIEARDDPTPQQLLTRINSLLSEFAMPGPRRSIKTEQPGKNRTGCRVRFEFGERPAQSKSDFASAIAADSAAELSLFLRETARGFEGTVEFASQLFDVSTIERIASSWAVLLSALPNYAARPISQLPLLTASERDRVLNEFNRSEMSIPQDVLIHELFEEQVRRTPAAPALLCEGRSMSFDQLNAEANRLAAFLRSGGIVPDDLIALCIERNMEMVVAMLAILKAGAAYVPLDPDYPAERLLYMLNDAAPKLLLTVEGHASRFSAFGGEVVCLDSSCAQITSYDTSNLKRLPQLSDRRLAYVIYTSGSTGRPKGAMNEHRGMVNRILAQRYVEDFAKDDICCQKTSISFVDAVFEIFGTICSGLPLLFISAEAVVDSARMTTLIAKHGVTRLITVPSLAQSMLNDRAIIRQLSGLRSWTLSGEPVRADLLRRLAQALPDCDFIDQYGASEVSSDAACYRTRDVEGVGVPIGRPIPNVRVYVLDKHGQPLPIGVAGEICVAGIGVGRGYRNQPELSATRFGDDPFGEPGERMYRTGDLGRWRSDGLLECLGRIDRQIKIRGFRVEPAEIESLLLEQPNVREAVVVARDDVPGDLRLVAYVAASGQHNGSSRALAPEAALEAPMALADSLRLMLRASLPEYMVPAAIVILSALPKTPNGKLDRGSLPAPDDTAYATAHYQPPQGEVEQCLARIWTDILRVERVGRLDNFFQLGGHSLLVVQVMIRLRAEGWTSEVKHLYASANLAELARTLTRANSSSTRERPNLIPPGSRSITPQMLNLIELQPEQIEAITKAVPGGASNIEDVYPLAPLQEGLFFHHLLGGRSGDIYVRSTLLTLSSRSHIERLIVALQKVIDRHDVLRTAILWEELPRALQVVQRAAVLPVYTFTLTSGCDVIEQLREHTHPQEQRLDLRCAPLMRLFIAPDQHGSRWFAILQTHHIACDNESLDTLLAEIMAYFQDDVVSLPPPTPYRNHVAHALASGTKHDAERFFRSKLADVEEPTAPFGVIDVHGDGSRVEAAQSQLPVALNARIRQQARALRVSPATLIHAAWALVVARTSACSDALFGTVLLGRMQSRAGNRAAVGMFINTLPLRITLADTTARELVESTHRELAELLEHEQAALALAKGCSGIAGAAPLFTSLLNYLRNGAESWAGRTGPDPNLSVIEIREFTNYPIAITVDDREHAFIVTTQTDRRIGAERVLDHLAAALRALIDALESAPFAPALALPVLPEREWRDVVENFNATAAEYPAHQPIHVLFEEEVRRTPRAIAAIYEGEDLTYEDLNNRANQFAYYLRSCGIRPGSYVPILLTRSLSMLIAQIAVLKCGAIYVPIDPDLPASRRAFIVRDCNASFVLGEGERPAEPPFHQVQWVDQSQVAAALARQPRDNLQLPVSAASPAYLMYTSGSTGVPKGVVVPHRAVVRLVINNGYAAIEPTDCFAHYSNPAFDASTLEVWGALLNGARVVIVPRRIVLDVRRFAETLIAHAVTMLYMSVGLFNEYADALADSFRRIRCLMVGGDALDPTTIRRVLSHSPPERLLNVYGPTECTTYSTTYWIQSLDEAASSVPIGRPISNARVYILSRQLQPVPIGVAGELYIGGDGVALGYLNCPDLTAERFLVDPVTQDRNSRVYKTGDLGRWRANGTIEYLGRNDDQLKIRGFRVEPGEIESQLSKHHAIKEAVVSAREVAPGDKRLTAYVVARDSTIPPNADELRTYLQSVLPHYMIPSAFVALPRLPLTVNGKLDRRGLPAPDAAAYAHREYEPPQGEIEELLASIWKDLLRVDRVGRRDSFFELGGHSLLIVQMMERLRRVGLSTEPRRVFETQTLCALAGALVETQLEVVQVPANRIPEACDRITPEMLTLVDLTQSDIDHIVSSVPGGASNVQDTYPLVPLQEGILFHHLMEDRGGDTYIVSYVLSVPSPERLTEFTEALQYVMDRHDILRTAILWEQLPQPVQIVYRHAPLPVEIVSLDTHRDVMEQIEERMRPEHQRIDLRCAPLVRLQVAESPSGGYYVFLQLHHIICDHVTMDIILPEIAACMQGRGSELPSPGAFRTHVAQTLAHSRAHDATRFFRGKLADIDEPTAPLGLSEVLSDSRSIDESRAIIDLPTCHRIRTQAQRAGVTVATLFHAAWALIVARTSGRDDVVFGTVLLGRLQNSAGGTGHTLGLFINTLPVRLKVHNHLARELVAQAQQELVQLLNYEQASLAVAQRCSGIEGSAPLFSAVLNCRYTPASLEEHFAAVPDVKMVGDLDRTNYPFTLSIDDLGEGFALTVQSDRSIDPKRIVDYMQTAIRSLIDALEHGAVVPAYALEVLPREEWLKVTECFNQTQIDYPSGQLIHELFEIHARRTPTATALSFGNRLMSYAELNGRANQLAWLLRSKGVGPGRIVGLCVERGPDMIVGMLGIVKAGGAYLPLDPHYPMDRLNYMLRDAAPTVLLMQEATEALPLQSSAAIVTFDAPVNIFDQHSRDNVPRQASGVLPHDLAYVIYTSGSTGAPKGVMLEHSGLCNLAFAQLQILGVRPTSRVLQFASMSFDACTWEWVMALSAGACLCLASREELAPGEPLSRTLRERAITHATLPPIALTTTDPNDDLSLSTLIVAGEACPAAVIRQWAPGRRFINAYGPTETTVCASMHECPAELTGNVPIGKPLPNTQIFILDKHLQPAPIGAMGEIYIGGAQLARGYLNRPELTAERFIQHPFAAGSRRLYRTGDVGRWRGDGVVEYLGRNDQQIKIRGYRIEPGEIEHTLRQHPEVREAVVIDREDVPGDKRLVAYIVADRKKSAGAPTNEANSLRKSIVEEWESIYEDTYGAEEVSAPSFSGWKSSYTDQPIPTDQMEEWLAQTVSRIKSLKPDRVLEIGCGVGLLLQHIAPNCSRYVGSDFSAKALARLSRWVQQRTELRHVELLHRSATQFEDLPAGSFDLIIVNSVVQYFPDVEYLIEVVRIAARLLTSQGKIFIGDVRHLGLLKNFHTAVQLSKAAASVSVQQLKRRITQALAQEKELVIDPGFFEALVGAIPGISSTDVQLKRGIAFNELTRYRYDVVLHAGEAQSLSQAFASHQSAGETASLEDLHAALRERRHSMRFQSIPNARLVRECVAERFVESSDEHLEVGALRRQLNETELRGIDPEALCARAEQEGYRVRLRWGASEQPDRFDLEIDDDAVTSSAELRPRIDKPARSWGIYANDPLDMSFRQELIPRLREYLQRQLPDYMVPTFWVALEQLPLTLSGKIDRRALPPPYGRPDEMGDYVAPASESERALAELWAEVLQVDQVGARDNFFDLGGHSLSAMKLIEKIAQRFRKTLPIVAAFRYPTVRDMAGALDALQSADDRSVTEGLEFEEGVA